jgi:7-carboxy-7-deazaguanine synthase|uniref:7-carboxy-7-deazaguanine synthase n=1 Tax=Desulfobacca acetoxidans TaxID=60893 RepID=A0A7C3WRL1_9BACT
MAIEVCETFFSLLGESTYAGLPAFFIRLSGCNLRCNYCDTAYAYERGRAMAVQDLVRAAQVRHLPYVLVTGGEPLLQAETPLLLKALADAGYKVLLETNGSLPINGVDSRVSRILDIKCPGSGMADRMYWKNLDFLTDQDEVKFVISGQQDFAWAVEIVRRHRLTQRRLPVLISPVFGAVPPQDTAHWILTSGLPFRLNLQLHKYIWGPEARGV